MRGGIAASSRPGPFGVPSTFGAAEVNAPPTPGSNSGWPACHIVRQTHSGTPELMYSK